MVFDYLWEISTALINFEYSNALRISVAILAIVIVSTLSLRFRTNVKKKRNDKVIQKNSKEIMKQGLQARFKQAQNKLLEKKLSSEDRNKEKERESQALMKIMKLLQDRKDLFPESSLDDLRQQLNLYRLH